MKIQFLDTTFGYRKRKALYNNLSLTIELNQSCIGILGHNGAGKTTFLNLVCGILKPSTGKIEYKDIDCIAYLPFQNQLYDYLTIKENLEFWYQIYQNKKFDIKNEGVQHLINRLNLNELIDIKCQYLSSGEAKKTAIACLLLSDSNLFVLDEPFNGVDPKSIEHLIWFIKEEMNKGKSFIITAHQLDIIEQLFTEVIIIKKGKIEAQVNKQDMDQSIKSLYIDMHE